MMKFILSLFFGFACPVANAQEIPTNEGGCFVYGAVYFKENEARIPEPERSKVLAFICSNIKRQTQHSDACETDVYVYIAKHLNESMDVQYDRLKSINLLLADTIDAAVPIHYLIESQYDPGLDFVGRNNPYGKEFIVGATYCVRCRLRGR